MPRTQQTMLLGLRTSNMLISVLPTIHQLISKTFHLEGNQRIQNTKRYTENTLYRRNIEMVNAPRCSSSRIRCIQRRSVRTCFGNFRGQNGKIRHTGQTKIQRAEKQATTNKTEYKGKQFSFQKINCIAKACPYQRACAARFPKLSSLAAAASP